MDFKRLFDEAGCIGSLHAVRLSDGTEVSHDADRPHVLASVVKVPIGLEFYAQADAGRVDPTETVALEPALSNARTRRDLTVRGHASPCPFVISAT